MSQEIEIEYKAMLSKEEYLLLNEGLPFPAQAITQTNYYFETQDFKLKEAHSAIRIRKKGVDYVLTLKEPYEGAILETHDKLTEAEFDEWINGRPFAKENTNKQLLNLKINVHELIFFGALTTERKSFTNNEIIYELDRSCYNGQTDYELEIEAPTHGVGRRAMNNILDKFNIQANIADPKIKRFFDSF